MHKFLSLVKSIFLTTTKAALFLLVLCLLFSTGYVVRPLTIDKLPQEITKLIGEKEVVIFNTSGSDATRFMYAITNEGIEQIDPNDMHEIMRSDIQWIIDITVVKNGGSTTTILVIDMPLEKGSVEAHIRLTGAKSYTVSTIRNEPTKMEPEKSDDF